MTYTPQPVDTSKIELSAAVLALTEKLALHAHEVWSRQRIADGWVQGDSRDDAKKEHPCLIPYDELSDTEKQYDRNAALETLKVITALGYRIVPPVSNTDCDQAAIDAANQLLAQLQQAQANAAQKPDDERAELEQPELLAVWNQRREDAPEWRALPELYRHLARRLLKVGLTPMAREVARTALELTVPDPVTKERPLWSGEDTVELRQILGLALARSGNPEDGQQVLLKLQEEGHVDEETLGMLARTYKDQAMQHEPEDPRRHQLLKKASRQYREAYTRSGGFWTGINVATVERLLGESSESEKVARRVYAQCLQELTQLQAANTPTDKCYWHLATLGEAALNLGSVDEAGRWYHQAFQAAPKNYGDLNSTRRHARWLLDYWINQHRLKPADAALLDQWLPLPRVAVFSGHMLDHPDRPTPRFPVAMEDAVRRTIREWLLTNNALIGFSSAACGGDILFQEELQSLGGESRIVLPYGRAEFVADSVGFAGQDWITRYNAVLDKAKYVIEASPHRSQGDGISYDYANLIVHGLASVRAAELQSDGPPPIGLVLWNGEQGDGPGGTASVVRHWRGLGMDVDQIQILPSFGPIPDRLPLIHNPEPPALVCRGPECADNETRIMAMVFGDAVNFSKLDEVQVSQFIQHFLTPVATIVRAYGSANVVRNTWGDGLYLVFDNVRSAGLCALEVCDFVRQQIPDGWTRRGLPADLNIRTALHAGPVLACEDPLTGQLNFTGTHVSRAARLEPRTPAGEVYASQAFAALCKEANVTEFTCEYVKQLAWAKTYGTFPTFVLKRTT